MMAHDPLQDVMEERAAQDAKWGQQNHSPETWLVILVEEVGELGQAILHARRGIGPPDDIRAEAVQVCAVALAMLECYERHAPPDANAAPLRREA
jgi:NTP pyrophosphatase (non-canonical NTP hydrolase)